MGVNISCVKEPKFLGVLVDENLTWKTQIKNLVNKLNVASFIILRLKNFLPQHAERSWCCSLCYNHLRYTTTSWAPLTKKNFLEYIYFTNMFMDTIKINTIIQTQ